MAVKNLLSWWPPRPGIAVRLALLLIAAAVLAVMANLLATGKLSVLRVTEVHRERGATVVVPSPARVVTVSRTVAPAPVPVPFPSADALLGALDRVGGAVDANADTEPAELSARYQKAVAELERTASEFAVAAKKAGESPPSRFMPTVRSYGQHGGELIKLSAARHASMDDYSVHFERLNERVKKSLDHAWNIFGRVVARQSLVKLTSDLDELRRRYKEIVATDTVDPSTFDALGASEATLAQTLVQDRGGLTRADGKDWYSKSQEDLLAMSAARKALLQIDKQRKEGARRFGDDFTAVSQIVSAMGKTETYDARQSAASAARQPAAAGAEVLKVTTVLRTADPGPQTSSAPSPAPANSDTAPQTPGTARIGVVSREPAGTDAEVSVQRTDSTTTFETPNDGHRMLIFLLSAGVLIVVVGISVFTTLGVLHPVRRLLEATSRLARGETGVAIPRGGLRELDTLGQSFNDMAAQLAAAPETARLQQEQLEQKVAERTAQLQELAQLDPLTRLANRRHFFTLLNTAIENATRESRLVGVFFVDIDNFKAMNDGLGHEYGDQLLQTIAQRLSDSTHSFGFAARLGGDEFTVVYESASSIEDVRIAGLQLVKAFEEPLPLAGRELVLSVSAGASVFPEHATDAESLLRAADAALYQAKAHGRGQLGVFTPALLEKTTARYTVEQGLRAAIERGDFQLVFQPEVNLQTGKTELVEALLRWRLPDGGYASPGDFLGIAEASGLMFQINDWVLRRALETLAEWHKGPWPTARMAINISARQLFDHSFVDRVLSLLAEHKLPPGCIEIELTEHVLQTGNSTIAALRRLHEQGIAIALDDFGAGFSSLASLEKLPLTRIKLDGSLVASIDTSPRSASIARAIIQLCQDLGLSVTAEGIERLEQLTPLVGYPNLYGQGFLLASPQSAEQVLRTLLTVPDLTRALVASSVARLPEAQLAEKLPFVTAD